jgi:hypothetical protein
VVLAVLMRPVGGWLSGRVGPVPVLAASFAAAAALAVLAALHLPLLPLGTPWPSWAWPPLSGPRSPCSRSSPAAFSAPVGHLWHPYIVYLSNEDRFGTRARRPGWGRGEEKSRG